MPSNDKRICDGLRDFWGDRDKRKWFDRPWQPVLELARPNLVLYYGASFNPPHRSHAQVLATVHEAHGLVKNSSVNAKSDTYADMAMAGAMISCSKNEDLRLKTAGQNDFHKVKVLPLTSQDRLELWHRGMLEEGLDWATVTGMDEWTQLWDFMRFIGADPENRKSQTVGFLESSWERGTYDIRFARVVKLDAGKKAHSRALEGCPLEAGKDVRTKFLPLYFSSEQGSGEVYKPKDTDRVAMGLTITTNAGGQGSWWNEAYGWPMKLFQFTEWTKRWPPTSLQKTAQGGSLQTTIDSIWSCRNAEHTVWYVHLNAEKTQVESLNAWETIESSDDTQTTIQELKERGFYSPYYLIQRALEVVRS